jgi:hypothetical protein
VELATTEDTEDTEDTEKNTRTRLTNPDGHETTKLRNTTKEKITWVFGSWFRGGELDSVITSNFVPLDAVVCS